METRCVSMTGRCLLCMDRRLNTKLGCSIMDMPCDGQSASNPTLNGSTRWIRKNWMIAKAYSKNSVMSMMI
jgi:hypothetical protein